VLFNSLTYLVFFAAALTAYRLPFPWWVKKLTLICASYVFYAAGNVPYLLLLWLTTAVDFHLAKMIDRAPGQGQRRVLCAVSIGLNLGLLVYLKYDTFIIGSFYDTVQVLGWSLPAPSLHETVLPLGISFYTFESISYIIDVYRKKIAPTQSLIDYALFISFFPHLVAGPIVRSYDFLPQCAAPRTANNDQFSWGLTLLVIGLFQKCILADQLGVYSDAIFSTTSEMHARDAWLGAMAFSGQIYFDFSGYSTCAIGSALCFGFVLNDNFRCPYAAIGIADFWRRWHISLSTWLRDYVYIPLGGNHLGQGRAALNAMTTMFLGGLWHGASWHFVIWGLTHGVLILGERMIKSMRGEWSFFESLPLSIIASLMTYGLICVTWVLFRAHDLHDAFSILKSMAWLGNSSSGGYILSWSAIFVIGAITLSMITWQLYNRNSSTEAFWARLSWWQRSGLLAAMLLTLAISPTYDRAFIYFQF
jgi:alginate O-acetyltransferase complex protein AlgI